MTDRPLPPKPVYSLFSGGKDSFACTSVLQEAGLLKGCVLLDTGISADTWLEDVTKLCETHGFPYKIIPTPIRYEWFVWRYGFPGPGMHGSVMNYLKGRAIREFRKDHKEDALASGVRLQESKRRMFNTKYESLFERVTVYAPILHWTTPEVIAFNKLRGYEKPRTYLLLGTSGDCLCGAFAQSHERGVIEQFYPRAFTNIHRAELCTKTVWGSRSADARIKVHGEVLNEEDQDLLCFDCARTP